MSKSVVSALLNGLLASFLYIIVFGMGLGFVFMFLPSLPIFYVSLSPKHRQTYIAVGFATLLIALLAGLASATLFLLFLGIPAWYFSKRALLRSADSSDENPVWYPIGSILLNLTLYAVSLVALLTWYYHSIEGGLPGLLSQNIKEAFSDMEGDYGDIINRMATGWSFLMFPITIWLWGILLYGHAWIANKLLGKTTQQLRPDMAVQSFDIPSWMLTLVAISALATLIGSPSMAFLGKSTLLTLMLPYFFLGCTLMHRTCKTWPSSRFFIFFIYFLAFTQFWPALVLAAIGLWHQIKSLSGSGSWSKS
jgi:hypothetical protein